MCDNNLSSHCLASQPYFPPCAREKCGWFAWLEPPPPPPPTCRITLAAVVLGTRRYLGPFVHFPGETINYVYSTPTMVFELSHNAGFKRATHTCEAASARTIAVPRAMAMRISLLLLSSVVCASLLIIPGAGTLCPLGQYVHPGVTACTRQRLNPPPPPPPPPPGPPSVVA